LTMTLSLHYDKFIAGFGIKKVTLPRAISFCAACYSIGLPPEILAFNTLHHGEIAFLNEAFVNLGDAMREALRYLNENVFSIVPKDIRVKVRDAATRSKELFFHESDMPHKAVTDEVIQSLKEKRTENLQSLIIEAAHMRRFLG
ncbi:MAG: phosphoenolpyruvate carboxylase, partial [Thermodesulfovibrionales bacterium]|nr:phosphoenolpyruvate carboxylase [Thermodesulfovibrionales bacterium]